MQVKTLLVRITDLHWLDVADRVTYKLGVIMHRCRHGKAPQYLVDCCTSVTDVVGDSRTLNRGTVNRGTIKRGQLIAGQLIAWTHNRSDN